MSRNGDGWVVINAGRGNCNINQAASGGSISTLAGSIVVERAMHSSSNDRRVALSLLGVTTCAMDVFMRLITLQVQKLVDRRVRRIGNPTWLVDESSVPRATRSPQTIHTPVEIRPPKFVFVHEVDDHRLLPIRTAPRPFDEDSGTNLKCMFRNTFKCCPQSLH